MTQSAFQDTPTAQPDAPQHSYRRSVDILPEVQPDVLASTLQAFDARYYRACQSGTENDWHETAIAGQMLANAVRKGVAKSAVPAVDGADELSRQDLIDALTKCHEKHAAAEQRILELEDEAYDAKYVAWPEWATDCLKQIREFSGYDGYDDWEGVDLPEELRETLAELEGNEDRAIAQRDALQTQLAEATVKIETLTDALEESGYRPDCDCDQCNLHRDAVKAEAAAKPQPGAVPEDLMALSDAATPGPWFHRQAGIVLHGDELDWIADHPDRGQHQKIIVSRHSLHGGSSDYAFIAAMEKFVRALITQQTGDKA